jgi:hypothetical protein
MKLSAVLLLLFIVSPLAHGCGRPAPRPRPTIVKPPPPPPPTITGIDGDFVVDPRFLLVEGKSWTCLSGPNSGQCYTRFRIELYLELSFFDMTAEQEAYCACGVALGGPLGTEFNNKRAIAPFLDAIVEQATFITFDIERKVQTSVISSFELDQSIKTKDTLNSILTDPNKLLTQVDGFLALVKGFDSNDYVLLDNNEAVFVKFLVTVSYDTSMATTSVAPAQVPGCPKAILDNTVCGNGEVNEQEINNPSTLPHPNFAFKFATGSSDQNGAATGGHPVSFAPGTYAAGQCSNDTMCTYCAEFTGDVEQCFSGRCDMSTTPGLCRMCFVDGDCSRFSLPNLEKSQGGPFNSTCNDNKVCTRMYIEYASTESVASSSQSLFF